MAFTDLSKEIKRQNYELKERSKKQNNKITESKKKLKEDNNLPEEFCIVNIDKNNIKEVLKILNNLNFKWASGDDLLPLNKKFSPTRNIGYLRDDKGLTRNWDLDDIRNLLSSDQVYDVKEFLNKFNNENQKSDESNKYRIASDKSYTLFKTHCKTDYDKGLAISDLLGLLRVNTNESNEFKKGLSDGFSDKTKILLKSIIK